MSFAPTAAAALNHWVRILAALEKKINRQSFDTWLKPTRFSHITGKTLYVRIPSAEFEHIGDRYADLIQEAIDNLNLEVETVTFQTPAQDPAAPKLREDGGFAPLPSHSVNAPAPNGTAGTSSKLSRNPAPPPAAGVEQARFDWNAASQLNPRYVFDGFVTGSGNQFAMAAAQAVAERPSKAYNPLFLYGGSGMGKTHLMQAIGHDVKRRQPHASISYLSGEKFTNEMINSVRYDKMTTFRDKYRTTDVLLIDDIQFLAGKERTQEEFFHTFNALHESMKQIVIASDRPPKELADFEDRLRSRFEWGLTADIQPPDLETKVAILQKKAESEHTHLPTDVALFIASNVRTNVRELEGALVRLIAWASMHGVDISLAVAQQCLKQFIDTQIRKISIETIQRTVAENFGMRVAELKQKNNSRQIVVPRQIAMYLAKQLTEASLPEIGRQFGGKHHTTVMHSIAKIDEQKRTDADLSRTLSKLMETLG
ncbi:chromosomal replication initiator protein DnaA [Granulicella aggregans]|uniref:chromosomal replication initiator protein DnaA n=1 Tax=Granulicella aggregans TaxID=474949 RepID=UPI0021E0DC19|nr:chromosomal replication initiator protein DnaA [Granulicella aggregans]